jgi:hypothetical protein
VTAASLWFCQFSKTARQTAQRAVSIFAVIRVRLILAAKVLKLSVIKELYHKKRATPDRMLLPLFMRLINVRYETSIALVTFSFGYALSIWKSFML